MFKKLIFVGGALTLVGFLVFGGSAMARLHQSVAWVRGKVQDTVPVEYELDRARSMIEEMAPEIRECRVAIANKQVELKYIDREVTKLEERYHVEKGRLEDQAAALSDVQPTYVFLGRRVARGEMTRDAQRRFERVRSAKSILESKYACRTALSKALDSAKETLARLEEQQLKLRVNCDELEAKLRENEALKAETLDIDFDHSRLATVKSILEGIDRKLEVERQLIDNSSPLIGESLEIEVNGENLSGQISAWLRGSFDSEQSLETQAIPTAESTLQSR
ncbi:MAG: hypothetical protein KDB53_10260 [Planctomycetes bacterium]|nr:hypothetical protein [Planctomycetota bacterium]